MGVALAVFVQRESRCVAVFQLNKNSVIAYGFFQRQIHRAVYGANSPVGAFQQVFGAVFLKAVLSSHFCQQFASHFFAGSHDRPARHPRLPAGRRRACRADLRVYRSQHHFFHPQHFAGDLLSESDEALTDFGAGALDSGDISFQQARSCGIVVKPL